MDDARWREYQEESESYSDRYTSLGLQKECPVGVGIPQFEHENDTRERVPL
jgi:hypothetical protein